MQQTIYVTKADGSREAFDESKLFSSLIRSGSGNLSAREIVEKIKIGIFDGEKTSQIYKKAFAELKKREVKSSAIYSLRRAVMELGPTGFPFEDFFAEVLKTQGYTTVLDQTVEGRCVPHEVDVVAYNDSKLIMVETKFHNEQGFKTDLKVVLYIKARFDDLYESKFMYLRERSLDEGWLVTNTKFTSQAIQYANCHGLKLIGWNYPEKGNLQDLISESGLHPLTCLASLSAAQKKDLMTRGFVLCKELLNDPQALLPLSLSAKKKDAVLAEVREIFSSKVGE